MEIVVASKEQLSIIQQLAHDIWFTTYQDIISDEQIHYMLEMIYSLDSLEKQLNSNHVFLLVKQENSFIGFASYESNFDSTQNTKIHKIYILSQNQGNGVGKLVIEKLIDLAKQNYQTSLILNVNKYNKAVYFYKKVGFTISHEAIIDIGNSFVMDDFVMEKIV